jgi:AraC-like DNA-binding protein
MSVLSSFDDGSPGERLDYWRHVVADSIVPFDLRIHDEPGIYGRMRSRDFGAVRLNDMTAPPLEGLRTPKLVRRSDPELCKIDVQVDTHLAVEQNGRQALLRPGDFSFIDLSRPMQVAGPQANTAMLMFPRTLLPLSADELARLTAVRVPGSRGTGALISSITLQLIRHMDELSVGDGLRLTTTILDLLTTMLARQAGRYSAVEPDTHRRALAFRIRAFIEERLGDHSLTPRGIAAAHHISLRYLYKLFEDEGTSVAGWIRARRLERCRQDLLDPSLRTLPVGAIAARWGFGSREHFIRLFRAAYQLPPGEFRDRLLTPPRRSLPPPTR